MSFDPYGPLSNVTKRLLSNGQNSFAFDFSGEETITGIPITITIGIERGRKGFISLLRGAVTDDRSPINIINITAEAQNQLLPSTPGEFKPSDFKREKTVDGFRQYYLDTQGNIETSGGLDVFTHITSSNMRAIPEVELDELVSSLHRNRQLIADTLIALAKAGELSIEQIDEIAKIPQAFVEALHDLAMSINSDRPQPDPDQLRLDAHNPLSVEFEVDLVPLVRGFGRTL